MIFYMKKGFVIIYKFEILSARRKFNTENLTLEKLVMNVPVSISQTSLCCSVGLAFLHLHFG